MPHIDEATQAEFQLLMSVLDLGVITRKEWDRMKVLVVLATMEAGDSESGQRGYERVLGLWRTSRYFDGQD
jgi:hypothetical protein